MDCECLVIQESHPLHREGVGLAALAVGVSNQTILVQIRTTKLLIKVSQFYLIMKNQEQLQK